MAHRIPEINVLHLPSVTFKLMTHHPVEVLFVHGIVAAKSCAVIVIHNCLILMVGVVSAEVLYQCRNLAFKLRVERLNHVQPSALWLSCHYPVNVSIVVHSDANGLKWIKVFISSAVQLVLIEVISQRV